MCDKPLISVIIPVYNPGKYFQACIDSIVNQTYRNLEIILIDDGSTDGSGRKCDEYALADCRVKVIHQKNAGVSRARNVGLKIATGDFYHFPDSDDYIELDSYEYLLSLIEKHKCDAVNFEHYITYPDKEIAHRCGDDFYGLYGVRDTLYKLASGVQFCWNKFFSKKIITENNGLAAIYFHEDIARGEDTLFAASALQRAGNVWFDKRALYHYVQTEESACRGKFRENQLTIIKLYDAFEPIYERYPDAWRQFEIFMQGILINLYYDIWADDSEWTHEKKELAQEISMHYKKLARDHSIPFPLKTKFFLFHLNPDAFSKIHKLIHKL